MPRPQTVLLLGATGQTGRCVLRQLLDRGFCVRVIVRSAAKLPNEVAANPCVTVIEASLLSLSDDELGRHVLGCFAVVSCLGHVISLRGIFGPPRDLVTQATRRICRQIEASKPAAPLRFILMSSVSVHRGGGHDRRRGAFQRAFLWLLRTLIPPAQDNQRAADFLIEGVGSDSAFVEWVAVRPDTLLDGPVSRYTLSRELTHSVFAPASTHRANVAHFMCELLFDPATWAAWKGTLPVITDAPAGT